MIKLISKKPLSEVCEINPRDVNGLSSDSLITFVPMSAVNEKTGSISTPEIRPYAKVVKGYTPFKDRDVLFAKITPCMENGKCAIAKNLENGRGFGSTEFHILRAGDKIIPEWVYFFLRQDEVRKFAANNMTGTAGQQRVPRSVFDRLLIPLPPLPVQKQIAAVLEKADAAREKRSQANQLTEQFLQSAFLEMFGDPITNPKGWNIVQFGDIVSSTKLGIVRGSSEQSSSFPLNYVKMNNIVGDGYLDLSNVTRVRASNHEVDEYSLRVGDFLFNTRNSLELVGKTALFLRDGLYLFNNNILRVRFLSSVRSEYINQLFQTRWIQHELDKRKSGTTSVFAIYYKELKTLPIMLPPYSEQERFAALVKKVESLRAKQLESEKELGNLFQSLMQKAFKGELVKK